jgi:hypothetical protein
MTKVDEAVEFVVYTNSNGLENEEYLRYLEDVISELEAAIDAAKAAL